MRIHRRPVLSLLFAASLAASLAVSLAGQAKGVRWFPAQSMTGSGRAWTALFSNATLSIGRYRLKKGGTDGQSPHAQDEVYFVIAGKAKFTAGKETRAVAAGDAIFVAARMPHRFSAIEADLDLLVFFSKAKKGTGGMAAGPRPTEQTPYPETSQRGNTRIFYWFGPGSAGQVSMDFGQPVWKQAYGRFLAQPSGRRWRFGQNFWTTLDTNIPLVLGGVTVPIGAYYAVLEHTKKAGLRLVLLDPAVIRKRRLDAYEAPKTTGGLSIPLQSTKSQGHAPQLALELTVDRSQRDRGALYVRFGPHTLRASLEMKPAR